MKLHALIENHRTEIVAAVNAVSVGTWAVSLLLVRSLAGAGLILLYLFYNATSETTIYQLSRVAHAENFWLVSFMLAAVYSAMHVAFYGYIGGHRLVELSGSMQAQASSASPSDKQNSHPKGECRGREEASEVV